MRAVLDTSVLIATDVPELDGELAISAASLAELHFGVFVTPRFEDSGGTSGAVGRPPAQVAALPIDEDAAVSYGRLAAAAAGCGRQPPIRVMDLLIAATAHAHGARLNTRDAQGLVGIEDIVDIVAV